ncbi:MAG: cytochrome-c peroxidase [Sphingobacteriia bacterium]|nr:cytochrome-c peroxidase [Sphingobacteriia bacterium]
MYVYFRYTVIFGLLLTGMFGFLACQKERVEIEKPHPYTLDIPKNFPSDLNIPIDNPLTEEGVKLGRFLFYDGRMSGRNQQDSLMSCGTCHIQSSSFECGINHPKFKDGHPFGLTGIKTPHVMLPFINLVFNNNGYFWNGMIHPSNPNSERRTLEDIVYMGVIAPHELHGDSIRTVKMIQSIKGYPELFEKAFGSNVVTMKNISKAIAQFIRTLISTNSKFDRYCRGEEQLTYQEYKGWIIFEEEADCANCHGSILLTNNLFFNNGKQTDFSGANEDTRDRFHYTGITSDIGSYKATTLRNIDLTGPYMHDGRFKSLDEVINFYSEGIHDSPYISPQMQFASNGGMHLNADSKAALKAFLMTLHDNDFINNPAFARPALFPDNSN